MSVQTRNILKAYFEAGDKPTEQQFIDFLDSVILKGDIIPTGNIMGDVITLTYGATTTWDLNEGKNAKVLLTGDTILDFDNVSQGFIHLQVKQDGTGGHGITLPAGSKVGYGGAGVVSLTVAADAIDILSAYYDGTNWFWLINKNFT